MEKVSKAWVKTHRKSGNIRFYTAHIRIIGYILGFIPFPYVMYICYRTYHYPYHSTSVFELSTRKKDKYWFDNKDQAENELMEQINHFLDEYNHKKEKKQLAKS